MLGRQIARAGIPNARVQWKTPGHRTWCRYLRHPISSSSDDVGGSSTSTKSVKLLARKLATNVNVDNNDTVASLGSVLE